VQLAVDGNAPRTLLVNSCLSQGCIASASFPGSFVTSARHGKALFMTFGAPDGQKLTMSIALKGFGLAYDRLSR
jgi:invasion protein IalB